MGMLDHWQPIAPVAALKNKQLLATEVAGKAIVLFRNSQGRIGALDDTCPHRRLKLSAGTVVGDKLQCRYHGWTFDCEGQGESPGTPKLHACAGHYSVCEAQNYIWLKSRDSNPKFPEFNTEGFTFMCHLQHESPAPLELTVDNFCEIEHTPTTHAIFGYQLERMKEVQVRFETDDNRVRVINTGPPKKLGTILNWMIGIRNNYIFNDDWTTYFSPVYSIYEHFWSDPITGEEAKIRWRLWIFFVPSNDYKTKVITFAYAKSKYPGPNGCLLPFRGLMRKKLDKEIQLDIDILSKFADFNPDIEGMKLSRFDRVLGLNRERIARIYRGISADQSTLSISKPSLRLAK